MCVEANEMLEGVFICPAAYQLHIAIGQSALYLLGLTSSTVRFDNGGSR